MEDFDYIGTGGFIIECQGNDFLGLTKEQAAKVLKECEFFRRCFDHDMMESNSRILRKPDWNIAIARHIVEALTKGWTTLPSLELYQQVMIAADQALIDLRLCNFINYMDATHSKYTRFLDLISDETKYYCFTLKAKVTSDQWLKLLETEILLNRDHTNFVVKLFKDQALTNEQVASRRHLDSRFSSFRVHADRSIQALIQISKILNNSCDTASATIPSVVPKEEECSVYFETPDCLPKDHHELIDRLAGGQAFVRTCADAAEFQTEGYTVKASFDVLKRSIEPLVSGNSGMTECSLRIDNPSPDTLGRLINASQNAEMYPSTIGLDASMNRYFCRKTLKDICIMLDYMADYSMSARLQGDFAVHVLSSEDKPF